MIIFMPYAVPGNVAGSWTEALTGSPPDEPENPTIAIIKGYCFIFHQGIPTFPIIAQTEDANHVIRGVSINIHRDDHRVFFAAMPRLCGPPLTPSLWQDHGRFWTTRATSGQTLDVPCIRSDRIRKLPHTPLALSNGGFGEQALALVKRGF